MPFWSSNKIKIRKLPACKDSGVRLNKFANEIIWKQACGVKPSSKDRTFTDIDHNWLISCTPALRDRWFHDVPDYESEGWDCDDYAFELRQQIRKAIGRANIPANANIAVAEVKQNFPYGGIGVGGYHAVCIIRTTEGFFVVEPQSYNRPRPAIIPLDEYKNPIRKIQL